MRRIEQAETAVEPVESRGKLVVTETWGQWINRNYKTEEERKAFADANIGTLYMSDDQFVGETGEQFEERSPAIE